MCIAKDVTSRIATSQTPVVSVTTRLILYVVAVAAGGRVNVRGSLYVYVCSSGTRFTFTLKLQFLKFNVLNLANINVRKAHPRKGITKMQMRQFVTRADP